MNVYRAYVPTVEWTQNWKVNIPTASVESTMCLTQCVPSLVHRKVWAFMWTSDATVIFTVDLVARLHNSEVYRQKIGQWNSGNLQSMVGGFYPVSTAVGALNEQIFTKVNGTNLVAICPWRMNIAASSFELNVQTVSSGVGAVWDLGIWIQSQQGI